MLAAFREFFPFFLPFSTSFVRFFPSVFVFLSPLFFASFFHFSPFFPSVFYLFSFPPVCILSSSFSLSLWRIQNINGCGQNTALLFFSGEKPELCMIFQLVLDRRQLRSGYKYKYQSKRRHYTHELFMSFLVLLPKVTMSLNHIHTYIDSLHIAVVHTSTAPYNEKWV